MAATKASTSTEKTTADSAADTASKSTSNTDKQAARDELQARQDELNKPAEIPAVDTAAGFSTSGAPGQNTDFDPSHPAIDNDPRAGTSVAQNRADFNDPDLSMEEAVVKNLKEGGSGVVVEGSDKKD